MDGRGRQLTRPWARALHLGVLTNFAVAQPVFDLLGRQPEFLVAHRLRPFDLILMALSLSVLLPMATLGIWQSGRVLPEPWRRRWDHYSESTLLALLGAAMVLPLLKGPLRPLPGLATVLMALACGCCVAMLLARFQHARSFLSILSPVVVLFPAIFLFSWPVRWLVFPPHIDLEAASIKARIPIVMVVFDELSLPTLLDEHGMIDADRFPNFAELAARATWFPSATTVADSTFYGVPAILTGNLPSARRLPTFELYPRTLFSLLGGSYRFEVDEPMTSLCPEELCDRQDDPASWHRRAGSLLQDTTVIYLHRLLPADFTHRLPAVTNHWRNFGRSAYTEDKAAQFRRSLAAIRGHDEVPTLFFQHCLLPHAPWEYLPSGRRYQHFGMLGLHNGRWSDNEGLRLMGLQRYLLQLRFADRLLGELLATLQEFGLYDRALLVVTADHGVSFHPGIHHRTVHPPTFADIMMVPLFFKLPGQMTGARSALPASTIDILPSIIDLLGLEEPPWPVAGSTLFSDGFPERENKVVYRSLRALGRRFEFPTTAFVARQAAVDPLLRRFGSGSEGLFKIEGLAPELIGKPIEEVAALFGTEGEAEILRPRDSELFYADDPARLVPAMVIGRLSSPAAHANKAQVAVVVNGIVRAVSGTFYDEERQETRFAAMIPEASLIAGQNRVEAFILRSRS